MPIIVRGDPSKPRAKARFSVGSPVNSREAGQQFNFGKLDDALLLIHFPNFLSYLHSFSTFFLDSKHICLKVEGGRRQERRLHNKLTRGPSFLKFFLDTFSINSYP